MNQTLVIIAFSLVSMVAGNVHADRLKELADLEGARPNQLVGYGLVVGLAGTGDDASAPFSAESIVTMLERMGTQVDASRLRLRNVAGVMVTAELPAFVRPGQAIDINGAFGSVVLDCFLWGCDFLTDGTCCIPSYQ